MGRGQRANHRVYRASGGAMSVLDALAPLFDQLLMLTIAALAVMLGFSASLCLWLAWWLAPSLARGRQAMNGDVEGVPQTWPAGTRVRFVGPDYAGDTDWQGLTGHISYSRGTWAYWVYCDEGADKGSGTTFPVESLEVISE